MQSERAKVSFSSHCEKYCLKLKNQFSLLLDFWNYDRMEICVFGFFFVPLHQIHKTVRPISYYYRITKGLFDRFSKWYLGGFRLRGDFF